MENQERIVEVGDLLVYKPLSNISSLYSYGVILVAHICPEHGSYGFTLNAPTPFNVSDALEGFGNSKFKLHQGGPCDIETVFTIHRIPSLFGAEKVNSELSFGGDIEELQDLVARRKVDSNKVKFCAGYVGWEAGQLEDEVYNEEWVVAKSFKYNKLIFQSKNLWSDLMSHHQVQFPIFKYNFPLYSTSN